MNKLLFPLLIIWALAENSASAQTDSLTKPVFYRWSVTASGGYGFPFAQEYIGSTTYQNTPTGFVYTNRKGSLGNGILNTITLSYRVKERISIELGAFANWGRELNTYHYYSDVYPEIFNDKYVKVNTRGVIIGFSLTEKCNKIEIGLHNYFLCSFFNRGYLRQRHGDDADEFITIIEDSGGIGIGWMNKLSVQYEVSKHFSVGLEGFIVLQTWSPKQGEFIEKSLNGVDGASSMPDHIRIFTYPESYTNVPNNPYVYTSAGTYPLHSCGASLRLGYSF